jgi:riboflavin synthase
LFTGIVQEVGSVVSLAGREIDDFGKSVLDGLELGASVAINGVCSAITTLAAGSFTVDVVPGNAAAVNLGELRTRDRCEPGTGPQVQWRTRRAPGAGHIDDTGTVTAKTREGEAILMRFPRRRAC